MPPGTDGTMAIIGAHLAAGRVPQAIALLETAIEEWPGNVQALNWLAIIRGIAGRNEEALALLERAAAANPRYAHVHVNRGNILVDLGRLPAAIDAYSTAIRLDPDAAQAMYNLAVLMLRYGLDDDAERLLRTAIGRAPRFGLAYYLLSKLMTARTRHEEAVQCARMAMECMPRGAISIHLLAYAHMRNGDPKSAVAAVRGWLETEPENQEARHILASLQSESPPPRAVDGYVEVTFDRFAASFDAKLALLEYRAPALMGEVLRTFAGEPRRALRILDAGCGTGLCAAHAREFASFLCGVDLSAGMLAKAERTGLYDALVKAELTAFLAGVQEPYDVVLSADTICYFGALEDFAAAAASALVSGGLLTFTVEASENGDAPYRLDISARYQHAEGYVRSVLGAAGFEIVRLTSEKLRTEFSAPVIGHLVVARRT